MAEQEKSIGALWEKKSSKGTWFSGSIEVDNKKISIVVFSNDFKKEDKHPDYKIYVSQPKKQEMAGEPIEEPKEDEENLPF